MQETPINDCALALMLVAKGWGGNDKLAELIELEWMLDKKVRARVRYWSTLENIYLAENRRRLTDKQLGLLLNRSPSAIKNKVTRLNKLCAK